MITEGTNSSPTVLSPVVLIISWAQSSIPNQQCPLGRDRECFLDARVAINFLPLTYCKSTRS